jgi:hypothetical protein
MSFGKLIRYVSVFALLLMWTGIAVADGLAENTNTTSSQLEISATVQTVVQLNISIGSGGATVAGNNSTGVFNLSLGNVNGLGVGTPASGVSVVADGSGALYKTTITLTPLYSGFTTETATISLTQDAAGNADLAREGDSSISAGSTVSTTTPRIVASGKASGTDYQRYVGMYVARTEPAGPKTVTLIYTITVD